MRICFICGSLEPGKDGVGDYTRRLACELIRQGHKIEIISLNDKHIQLEWKGLQEDHHTDVPITRLSYLTSWEVRLHCIKEAIAKFEPDWISLQFVLFTFHKKGLPFRLANKMKKLNNGVAKWHIMFHELWVGMNIEAPLKLRLMGAMQKRIIKSFVGSMKPLVVHTHAYIYVWQLNKMHIKAKQLPLFTNLLVSDVIYESSKVLKEAMGENIVIFCLFGGIHPGAPVKQFADELITYCKNKNITPEIKIIGKAGEEQRVWFETFTSTGIIIKLLGELPTDEVTRELGTSHYGISTTPKLLAGKSSAIATMLGHQLPVLCVAKEWQLPEILEEPEQGIFGYEAGNLAAILETHIDEIKVHSLADISKQFLHNLSFNS